MQQNRYKTWESFSGSKLHRIEFDSSKRVAQRLLEKRVISAICVVSLADSKPPQKYGELQ
jgi:hypothetical protein